MRVLVTGASGFCGAPVAAALAQAGHEVIAAARAASATPPGACETRIMSDLAHPFDAAPLVQDVDAVVHLAGLAHQSAAIPESVYRAVNCDAARNLAEACRAAGVKHFVFVSSVRAQVGPSADTIVTEGDPPEPTDAYGHSKLAGEYAVSEALAGSATKLVILRPVLMYGAAAKGNMRTLMRRAAKPWPLPLGALTARRSLLAVENFADAIQHVLAVPAAARGTFLVADGAPFTVPDIIAALRAGLGRKPGLVTLPLPGLPRVLTLTGRHDLARRLFGDLVVATDALARTGWQPPMSTRQALGEAMARAAAGKSGASGDTPL